MAGYLRTGTLDAFCRLDIRHGFKYHIKKFTNLKQEKRQTGNFSVLIFFAAGIMQRVGYGLC
jgi:hypothetical protein